MSRADRINLALALLAIAGALAAATIGNDKRTIRVRGAVFGLAGDGSGGAKFVTLDDGRSALLDANRTPIVLDDYRHIVSGSTVADWLLLEFCEPDRIRAVTETTRKHAPWAYRFASLAGLASLGNIEVVLGLQPDLLIMDSFGDPRRVARFRDNGLAVFDLGEMRGLATLWPTIERIGALCGQHARAREYARRWRERVTGLAAAIGPEDRARALYLSPYGDKLFGGTIGTGYHDILHHAGLRDAAAGTYRKFPEYSAEQVLALDPDLLVTRADMGAALCRHAGLTTLRACRTDGAVIELPSFALDDPGLGVLESIETLYRIIHGARPEYSAPEAPDHLADPSRR